LREIRVSQGFRVLMKELVIGAVNGLAIAVVTSIGVYLWSRNLGLCLVMFIAMIVSMVAASAAGAMIPIVLVKLNRDPATASSIILTTVTDIVGFFTFLGLATLLAGMLAGT
jgi:magnesium transporter